MDSISERDLNVVNWSTVVIITIAFWLSSITVLDLVIIPSLSSTGMMNNTSFASAGYVLFEVFNHIEIICAAVILTGVLSYNHLLHKFNYRSFVLAIALLLITLVDTYLLTPQMSGLGLSLNMFDLEPIMSKPMLYLHESYWLLDLVKLFSCIYILRYFYHQERRVN